MITVRVMRDGRPLAAVGSAALDTSGLLAFPMNSGDSILYTIDYTAFLGSESYSSGAWQIDGGTFGAKTQSGKYVTAIVNVPDGVPDIVEPSLVRVTHRLTTSGGRITNTSIRIIPVTGSATDLFILDGSVLA